MWCPVVLHPLGSWLHPLGHSCFPSVCSRVICSGCFGGCPLPSFHFELSLSILVQASGTYAGTILLGEEKINKNFVYFPRTVLSFTPFDKNYIPKSQHKFLPPLVSQDTLRQSLRFLEALSSRWEVHKALLEIFMRFYCQELYSHVLDLETKHYWECPRINPASRF